MKTKTKSFKVFAPTKTKDITLNENGTLTITGIASTTNRDLDGDIVTQEAIESLQKQVVGLNLHLDHTHTYEGGIGAITGATVEDNSLLITAVVLPEYATGIKERLDIGMNFGFSIGGIPEFGMNYDIITDFKLLEVSLTLLPANWDTFGTIEAEGVVKSNCLTGACHHILKNLTGDTMRTKAEETQGLTEEQVISLINEALAENAQSFIDEIRNELTAIVNDTVDAKLEEIKKTEEQNIDETKTGENSTIEEEETKAGETTTIEEEETKSEEQNTDETKSDENSTIEEEENKSEEQINSEDVEKMVDNAVDKLFKRLDARRTINESKFNNFITSKKSKQVKFLNSEERDQFGRNKKYL